MTVHQFINSIFASNSFVISEGGNAWLFDIGDAKPIIDYLLKNSLTLRGVFLTHSHFDHIYGLNDLIEAFHDASVYTNENGKKSLYSDRWNMSKYNQTPFVYKYDNVVVLQDSKTLSLTDDLILKAYYTLGHDWSCISYLVGEYFFTGDSYMPEYPTIDTFPKSDKKQAATSTNLIKSLFHPGLAIAPGHGNMVKL
jgi:hydroxyacylglutathione hydrolase